jgi:hypothetical protein
MEEGTANEIVFGICINNIYTDNTLLMRYNYVNHIDKMLFLCHFNQGTFKPQTNGAAFCPNFEMKNLKHIEIITLQRCL